MKSKIILLVVWFISIAFCIFAADRQEVITKRINKLEKTIDREISYLDDFEKQFDGIEKERAALAGRVDDLSAQLVAKDKDIQPAKIKQGSAPVASDSQAKSLIEEINKLSLGLEEKTKESTGLRQQLEDMQKQIADLQKELAGKEKEIDSLTAKFNKQIAEKEGQVTDLREQVSFAVTQKGTEAKETVRLEKELKSRKREIKALAAKLNKQIASKDKEIVDLKKQLSKKDISAIGGDKLFTKKNTQDKEALRLKFAIKAALDRIDTISSVTPNQAQNLPR